MTGLKHKLAHKRVGRDNWNSTENVQKEELIRILEKYIAQLKREMIEEADGKPTFQDITK
jgi:hypothetical protein